MTFSIRTGLKERGNYFGMQDRLCRMLYRHIHLITDTRYGRGKPAGVRCVQLTADNRCSIFGHPERPAVCSGLQASVEMCGDSDQEAFDILHWMEEETNPARNKFNT